MTDKKTEAAPSGFASLGLNKQLLSTLAALGYEEPTPIQRDAIPALLEGVDLIGQAATGTGKTAAFSLPLIQRLSMSKRTSPKPSALVLVPTRELAIQVAEAIHSYGHPLGIRVIPIYGGQSYDQQIRGLKRGVDIVVATPGRAIDHLGRKTLQLDQVETVILDEADEMLDLGFLESIEAILSETPDDAQVVLFSATLSPRISGIARKYLENPVQIKIVSEKPKAGTMPRVRQTAYVVTRAQKLTALSRLLDMENPTLALIFCRTRTEVDGLAEALRARGYSSEALHGGMSQAQRDHVMKKLRNAQADLVIATDVAARGLDIDQLSHVVNFDVPSAPEVYVHRIGRVGRAGREGVAIMLAEPRECRLIRSIEQLTKMPIEMGKIPTVADMQARRLETTCSSIRETILEGDLDGLRGVVEALAGEFDLMDVALAAIKMARQANGDALDDQEEIETPRIFGGRDDQRQPRQNRFQRGSSHDMARLYIGLGRSAGIRPQDLVGAIAGETGIPGRQIGAIHISDKFSLVDIPQTAVNMAIKALSDTKIKGKKAVVRLDRPRHANAASAAPRAAFQ